MLGGDVWTGGTKQDLNIGLTGATRDGFFFGEPPEEITDNKANQKCNQIRAFEGITVFSSFLKRLWKHWKHGLLLQVYEQYMSIPLAFSSMPGLKSDF